VTQPVPAPRPGREAAPPAAGPSDVDAYLRRAVDGDGRAGVRLVLDLIDNGVRSGDVIVGLLAAAQREAGERWLANHWTVAEEHLVSGVSQKALDAVAHTIGPPPPTGLIAAACAEGDWHSLPAQMFAEMLRAEGFAVAFLGASTPADHVASFLSRRRPAALVVSCTMPLYFGGVTRLADAAHRHRIPVLAGGPALGRDPSRADRLGADAWAAGIDGAVAVLREWQRRPPLVRTAAAPVATAAVRLDFDAAGIAAAALASPGPGHAPLAALDAEQRAQIRADLCSVIRFAAAARLVGDPAVLTEMLDWLRTFHANRSVPAPALDAGLSALAPAIRGTDAAAAGLVADAIDAMPR
jgi:methanogenic corrinoid protein MtbC1